MRIFSKPRIFHRYSESAKRVVFYAVHGAAFRESPLIEPSDLLLGLARDPHADDCEFRQVQEQHEKLAALIGFTWMPTPSRWPSMYAKQKPALSNDGKRVLALAAQEANLTNCYWIGREHLQAALLQIEGPAASALIEIGYTLEKTRNDALAAHKRYPEKKPDFFQRLGMSRTFVFLLLGFLAGVLIINLYNLWKAH